MSLIDVKGLKKSYGDVHAVRGVDLEIGQGEIFSLLGPNGAGKTTTVEILEGYRNRDAGSVSVLGFDPQTRGEQSRHWRNRIGIVLQSTKDAEDLSVREVVAHFAKYYSNDYQTYCGHPEAIFFSNYIYEDEISEATETKTHQNQDQSKLNQNSILSLKSIKTIQTIKKTIL
ncbi:MAG: hypothetical protein RL622_964, partial [Actinomycetota bacterium]